MAVATVLGMSDHMPLTLAVTVACAVLLLHTGQNTQIKGDAAIAMVSVGALAMGYLLMNLFSTSANLSGDVCSSLFGSTSISDLDKIGSMALHRAFHHRGRSVYAVLQQDICSHL